MAFTKSAVEELSSLHGEPDWLRARRLTSFGIYEGLAVPNTKRQEDWRQVDLKGLDLDGYAPFQQPNGTAPLGALENVASPENVVRGDTRIEHQPLHDLSPISRLTA